MGHRLLVLSGGPFRNMVPDTHVQRLYFVKWNSFFFTYWECSKPEGIFGDCFGAFFLNPTFEF